jgi:hypothetical protein
MSKIVLGTTSDGKPFTVDLELLLRTRLLVQANSGGGKSYSIRCLIEQIFGKVQIILVDRDGEFKSLRDKFDFLLIGEGGDIPAHIGSARLLAEKILECGVSAICDLYEAFRTSAIDRMAWVREFLMGLVDAPKHLWHDVIVIVDEAHLFAPQVEPKGRDMKERDIISGCKDAMIALATVGRKRGQCAVWATQRLAKLDKDGTAELLNRMVGMTMEDQDVDRAVDLMSVSREDRLSFRKSLRDLEPGQFYVFGRAISKERLLVKVRQVTTRHEEAGSKKHVDYSPPTPAKIQALLSKFEDLPKEIEAKAKTEADLRKENAQLRSEVQQLLKRGNPGWQSGLGQKGFTGPGMKVVERKVEIKEVPVLQASELRSMEKILSGMDRLMKRFEPLVDLERDLEAWLSQTGVRLQEATRAAEQLRKAPPRVPPPAPRPAPPVVRKPSVLAVAAKALDQGDEESGELSGLQLRQLQGLLDFETIGIEKVERRWLSGWLGMSLSGHFKNEFGKLHKTGLVGYDGNKLFLTEEGRRAAPASDLEITVPKVLERCASAVSGLAARQLRHLHGQFPRWVFREELAQAFGMSLSGHFKNEFGTLHKAGMVEYGEGGHKNQLRCAEWLFLSDIPAGAAAAP